MKNLKKVIAFLMAAAMTLGMGAVGFAEEAETSIVVSAVEEAKAGDTVQIEVIANKDMCLNAFTYCIFLNAEKVEAGVFALQALEANYDSRFDSWSVWKILTNPAQQNWNDSGEFGENYFAMAGATTDKKAAYVEKGTVLAVLTLKTKTDLKAGDILATVTQPNGYADDMAGAAGLAKGETVNVIVADKR